MIFLMYHEIEGSNHSPSQTDKGYLRYVIKQRDFEDQLSFLLNNGFTGINISQALCASNDDPKKIVFTFDDGCDTDLLCAAPILKAYNFNATFFVVSDFINRKGFLSQSQLMELSNSGFEIGCHSLSHRFLTDLSDSDLQNEIGLAKDRLEQLIGKPVHHFSCPGGRWNRKVMSATKKFGFASLSTSKIGINSNNPDLFCLKRISILRNTDLNQFKQICYRSGIFKRQLLEKSLHSAKTLLGNSLYESLRDKLLSQS